MRPSERERNWMRDHKRSPTVDEFNHLKELREPVDPIHHQRTLVGEPSEAVDYLIRERSRAIDAAHRALNLAEEDIRRLRHNLNLAANGEPYRRVSGAGSSSLISNVDGLNLGPIFAAFDAIERVAVLTEGEDTDG